MTLTKRTIVLPKPEAEETFHEELWAYSGKRLNHGKEEVDRFVNLQLINNGDDTPCFIVDCQRGRRFTVGGIYAVEVSADGLSARLGGAKFKRMLPDTFSSVVLGWKTQHDVVQLTLDARKLEAKSTNMHLEILEPIRKLYRGAMPSRQAAIEVAVLRYLRRQG